MTALPIRLPGRTKVVLLVMAGHCCKFCGLTWLGLDRLTQECGVSVTTLRAAIADLVSLGHLKIAYYPKGGRGKATEYVVFPNDPRLIPARCRVCLENQQKGPRGGGFDKGKTARQARGIAEKPLGNDPQKGQHGYHPTVIQHKSTVSAASGASGPRPAVGEPATPADFGPPPTNAAEARARVDAMVKAAGSRITPRVATAPRTVPSSSKSEATSEGNGARPEPTADAEVRRGEGENPEPS